jgi:hypothetical protein
MAPGWRTWRCEAIGPTGSISGTVASLAVIASTGYLAPVSSLLRRPPVRRTCSFLRHPGLAQAGEVGGFV